MRKFLTVLCVIMMFLLVACSAKSSTKESAIIDSSVAMVTGGSAVPAMAVSNDAITSTESTVLSNRKLIRNVNMNMETTDFDNLITALTERVIQEGGYLERSDISGKSISNSKETRYARIIARVPIDALDDFLVYIKGESNVTYQSETMDDVTLQYTDLESKQKTLTIEQDRIWELLETADTMESIIALEERLSQIRYELESMESQLRTLDNQIDYSTISLSIDEVQVFTPTSPDSTWTRIQKGFESNINTLTTGAINLFVWFVSSLPTIFILVLFIGIMITLGKHMVKSKKLKKESKGDKAE